MYRRRKGPNVLLFAVVAVALIASLVSRNSKPAPAPAPVENVAQSETATLRPEDIPLPKVDSVPRKESTPRPAPAQSSEPATTTPEPATSSYSYVLNTNTMRIHKPDCSSVNEMNPKNRQPTNESIAELEAEGYVKCKRCF